MTLDGLLTVEEVAASIGVAPSTLREWARRSHFPHLKLPHSRRIMFARADVDAYLAGCALETKLLDGGGRLVQPARRRGTA